MLKLHSAVYKITKYNTKNRISNKIELKVATKTVYCLIFIIVLRAAKFVVIFCRPDTLFL